MKNAGLRYSYCVDGTSYDWIPETHIDEYLNADKRAKRYGKTGRDYVPKEYLRNI